MEPIPTYLTSVNTTVFKIYNILLLGARFEYDGLLFDLGL
jgi:hypothetical protein